MEGIKNMDNKTFLGKMGTDIELLGKEELLAIVSRSVSASNSVNPRGHRTLIVVMEELAELAQEVSKKLRGKNNYYNLLEEMADVQLALYYLQDICDISDEELQKAISIKAERVDKVVRQQGEYQ